MGKAHENSDLVRLSWRFLTAYSLYCATYAISPHTNEDERRERHPERCI